MNFQETEKYLLSLGNEVETMKLGLDNIRRLLAALGSPHEKYLKVQVAGTNGKGSVCAFLNSICVAAEIRTGMFTSPHLVSITERVKIDGVDISEEDFAKIATHVRDVSEKLVVSGELTSIPTFFEQVTAIALVAFANAHVQLAILETGLGGRLDATTAADAEICAITRIDIDHQKYLGETIEEIAAEKAAVIRAGSRAVIGEQQATAMEVILARCRNVGVEPKFANQSGGKVAFNLSLAGRHQVENARIALALAETVRVSLDIADKHIAKGLETTVNSGRLERIGQFLLDGAHNVGGARALRAYLDEFVREPITMVFGAMNDKDVRDIASVLFPKAHRLIVTQVDNSRALTPEEIMNGIASTIPLSHVYQTPDVKSALLKAREVADENDLILITGSLYLVGEARRILTADSFLETED